MARGQGRRAVDLELPGPGATTSGTERCLSCACVLGLGRDRLSLSSKQPQRWENNFYQVWIQKRPEKHQQFLFSEDKSISPRSMINKQISPHPMLII